VVTTKQSLSPRQHPPLRLPFSPDNRNSLDFSLNLIFRLSNSLVVTHGWTIARMKIATETMVITVITAATVTSAAAMMTTSGSATTAGLSGRAPKLDCLPVDV